MRRRLIVGLMGVLAASALVIGSTAGIGTASVKAAKAPVCKGKTKKQAIKDIKTAYDYFLNGEDHPESADKEVYIQYLSGDQISPQLKADFEASADANADAAATTNVQVNKVKCTGKKTADVDFDLVLNGDVAADLAPPGDAILEGKTWKVTALTLCNSQALGDPTILESGPCSEIVLGDAPSDATSG